VGTFLKLYPVTWTASIRLIGSKVQSSSAVTSFIAKSDVVNIRSAHIPSRANLSRVQLFTLQNVIKSCVSPENEQTSSFDKRECRQQLVVTSVYHTMLRVGGGRLQNGSWPACSLVCALVLCLATEHTAAHVLLPSASSLVPQSKESCSGFYSIPNPHKHQIAQLHTEWHEFLTFQPKLKTVKVVLQRPTGCSTMPSTPNTRKNVTSDRSVGMNAKRIDVPFQRTFIHWPIRVRASPRAPSPTSSLKDTGSSSPADKAERPYSHNLVSNLVQELMLRNTDSSPLHPPSPHDTSGEVIG
jgi:hypothetical protein